MKILITGAKGFIGRNLAAELKTRKEYTVFEYDFDSTLDHLNFYTKECEFVFHLAGVNRPEKESEFMEGNYELTSLLLECLRYHGNKAPVLVTSSIQALQDNPYGRSKKAAEELLLNYRANTGVEVLIFRLQNVFGKWCRPNYNSVVATFCHNIANNIPIMVNNRNHQLSLVYIDDVVDAFFSAMEGKLKSAGDGLFYVMTVYPVKLGLIADLILSFRESRENLRIPDQSDSFIKKLYSTYLSYIPKDRLSCPLIMNTDDRGSFTEFLKSPVAGQVSINISKPGITKGNHWHHTKNEKFLVVSGQGLIRLRKLGEDEIIEYKVKGDRLEIIDIPAGYTHNIINTGTIDMVTVMWANEVYDKSKPDTYFLEV